MIFRLKSSRKGRVLNVRRRKKGFTLIEILASLAILSVLTVIALSAVDGVIDDARFTQTVREMEQIRNALIGETQRLETGLRKNYGYLGDVGGLPTTSQGLAVLSSMPAGMSSWAIQNSYGIGMGWRGPYLANTFDQNFYVDAWGNAYTYTNTGSGATITSLGADGAAGGSGFDQDITLNIPTAVTTGKLLGYVVEGSGDLLGADQIPYSDAAEVFLYYPNGSGGIASMSMALSAGNSGKYSFSNIPLGFGALKVFIPSSAAVSSTLGPAIIEINKSATAAVPVTQDTTEIFSNSSACTTLENYTVSSGSFSSDSTNRTISFVINYPSDYTMSTFAYDLQTGGAMSNFAATNLGNSTTQTFRYDSGNTAITTSGTANISTTGSNLFTMGNTLTFSGGVNYRLTFQYVSTAWSAAYSDYYYRIGCKYVRAHPGM